MHIKEQSFGKNQTLFDGLKTFSSENKGFGVLKNEKLSFLIFFEDFFVEEQRIWTSKK